MDSQQILSEFKNEKRFIGVFPRNNLPSNLSSSANALIINTDSSSEPGEHWVAIYIENKKGEYFDSFGLPPLHTDFIKFLNNQCDSWIYNSCTIQHYKSKSCGKFCINFIKTRLKGDSYSKFISKFSVNLKKNEELL